MSLERVQELEAKVSAMSEDKARLMATVAKWEAYSATQTERAAQDTQLMRKLEDALEYLLSESDAGADFGMSGDDSPGQAAARDALKAFSARQERYVCAYHPIVTRPAGMPCPACEEEKDTSNGVQDE